MFDLEEEAGIDLTPLIDVVFMLLVFFIMTATFSRPVLDIALPEAKQTTEAPRQELVVAVRADGSLYHDNQRLTPQDVLPLLQSRPEALLNLYVDKDAPFEAFVSIVDAAKQHRGGRFVISTQSPAAR